MGDVHDSIGSLYYSGSFRLCLAERAPSFLSGLLLCPRKRTTCQEKGETLRCYSCVHLAASAEGVDGDHILWGEKKKVKKRETALEGGSEIREYVSDAKCKQHQSPR